MSSEFNTDELQAICARALVMAASPHVVPSWRRAYTEFADAADRLHAMNARTKVTGTADELESEAHRDPKK